MRDDQNNLQPLQPVDSEQQLGQQTGQEDFYVDPSDPYVNQSSTNNDFFAKSTLPSGDSSSFSAGLASKKPLILLFVVIAVIAVAFIMMPAKKTTKQVQQEERAKLELKKDDAVKTATPIAKAEDLPKIDVLPTPKALEPPPLITPKPPEPPPAPVPAIPVAPAFPTDGSNPLVTPAFPTADTSKSTTGSIFSSKEEEEAKKKALADRRKSAIMVVSESDSGGGAKSDDKTTDKDADKTKEKKKTSDGFLGFGDGTLNEQVLKKTGSAQVSATYLGRLDSTIAQGKIIDAVLETAVNSDLPGTLRAIVSRDVYAESGKAVLIPKGSRIIGTYAVELKPGQTRISVAWSRLIRPDGIDLALNSPGTDTLGRAGVSGFLDDKTLTKLATAFMVSYIIPTITNKVANVNDRKITQTQTTATDGSTTTTTAGGSVGSTQLKESSDKFQDIAQKAIEDSLNTKSTIYVDQGARINVFVNQDIVFPPQIAMNSIAKVVK